MSLHCGAAPLGRLCTSFSLQLCHLHRVVARKEVGATHTILRSLEDIRVNR